jgi:hypothetical protein
MVTEISARRVDNEIGATNDGGTAVAERSIIFK